MYICYSMIQTNYFSIHSGKNIRKTANKTLAYIFTTKQNYQRLSDSFQTAQRYNRKYNSYHSKNNKGLQPQSTCSHHIHRYKTSLWQNLALSNSSHPQQSDNNSLCKNNTFLSHKQTHFNQNRQHSFKHNHSSNSGGSTGVSIVTNSFQYPPVNCTNNTSTKFTSLQLRRRHFLFINSRHTNNSMAEHPSSYRKLLNMVSQEQTINSNR